MVSETTPMVLAKGHKHTVALDQSALLEALDALKAAPAGTGTGGPGPVPAEQPVGFPEEPRVVGGTILSVAGNDMTWSAFVLPRLGWDSRRLSSRGVSPYQLACV
jgi:hypothetical protein